MASALASAFAGLTVSTSKCSFFGGNESFQRKGFITAPGRVPLFIQGAHKKGSGSTKNGRDSVSKRLGVKIFGSQVAKPGSIIIRQRGTKFHPGNNVGLGRDYTIYSLIDGEVKFEHLHPDKKKVSVYPRPEVPENPNSRRVRKREEFKVAREKLKVKVAARTARLLEWYKRPARFMPHPDFATPTTAETAVAES